jgi:probable HAF family extracellular repeat protein
MGFRKAVLSLAAFLVFSMPLALAQGTYAQIDYPGTTVYTQCWGINAAGGISGTYWDASYNSHGFLLSGGAYTTIDYPGARNTFLTGINDMGRVVGYTDESGVYAGFVYDIQTRAFADINYPSAYDTLPSSINNAGGIAGDFYFYGAPSQGFVLAGSAYSEVTWPGSTATNVWGISSSGSLAGVAYGKNYSYFSFSLVKGQYRRVAIPNAPGAAVYGINQAGSAIVGSFSAGLGFLYQGGVLQTLQFPGAGETVATGVNGAGEVVGYFQNADSIRHGFTWTPTAGGETK